jgi:hypothetical protein
MGWTFGVLGFSSWWGLGIFLFTTMSRTALGPTQPPLQWVLGAVSLEIKWRGHEADNSPPSSTEVKECLELYLHSPNMVSWHCAYLKKVQGQLYLSTCRHVVLNTTLHLTGLRIFSYVSLVVFDLMFTVGLVNI